MTIDRQHNELIFICDECGDDYATGEDDFTAALKDAKDEGWLVTTDGNEWKHVCPDCVGTETTIT